MSSSPSPRALLLSSLKSGALSMESLQGIIVPDKTPASLLNFGILIETLVEEKLIHIKGSKVYLSS